MNKVRRGTAGFLIGIELLLLVFLAGIFTAIFPIGRYVGSSSFLNNCFTVLFLTLYAGSIGALFFRYKSPIKSFLFGAGIGFLSNGYLVYSELIIRSPKSLPFSHFILYLVTLAAAILLAVFALPKEEMVKPHPKRFFTSVWTYVIVIILVILSIWLHRLEANDVSRFTQACKNLSGKELTYENLETLHGKIYVYLQDPHYGAMYGLDSLQQGDIQKYWSILFGSTSATEEQTGRLRQAKITLSRGGLDEDWRCDITTDQSKKMKVHLYYQAD